MKIVINRCFGGFGLSPLAVKTIANRSGKECYFFETHFDQQQNTWTSINEPINNLFWAAFSISNPNEVLAYKKPWHDMTQEERKAYNDLYESVQLDSRYDDKHRNDPLLISVVEELGEAANGAHAQLAIVEIPDDVEWEIDEYDGSERVAEKHRTWD